MKVALYCTCGASATGTIKPDAKAAAFKRDVWLPNHSGPGHAPCDQRTAAKARAKEARAERRAAGEAASATGVPEGDIARP